MKKKAREEERDKETSKQKINRGNNKALPIIPLNLNGLNSPI